MESAQGARVGPDERKPTCGACVNKYLIEKEFCNVCYKTYPTELSALPILEAPVNEDADERGTTIDLKTGFSENGGPLVDIDGSAIEYIPYDSKSIPNSVRSPHIFIKYFTEDEFNAKSSIQKFPRPLQGQPSDAGEAEAGKKSRGRGKKRKGKGSPRSTHVSDDVDDADEEGENEAVDGVNEGIEPVDTTSEVQVTTTTEETENEVINSSSTNMPDAAPENAVIDESDALNVSMNSIELDNSRMVECSECSKWVHAQCEGLDDEQYRAISAGTHPVWGDEYLCPFCRIKVSLDTIGKLHMIDQRGLGMFAHPVTEAVAKNYFDVIRNPMDLETMKENATRGSYKSMQSLRQDWELMCLNAILFNKSGDEYWMEAKRFYEYGLLYFDGLTRTSHHSAFGAEVRILIEKFYQANPQLRPIVTEKSKKRGVKPSVETENTMSHSADVDTPEEIEDVPDSFVEPEPEPEIEIEVPLPTELATPADPVSYIPCFASTMPMDHALVICQRDQCLVCGSMDAEEFMLICIDCGEVSHSFCAEAPLATMDALARRHWRCTNCKICEACGTASESDSSSLIYCDRCDRSYHNTCVHPHVPELADSDSWICAACVKCQQCDGYCEDTYMSHTSDSHQTSMDVDAMNDASKMKAKVFSPVWGISSDQCIRCHREALVRAENERLTARSAELALFQEMIDSTENMSSRVCGICSMKCYPDSHILCNDCQKYFHLACMSDLCEPWIPDHRFNSDFLCTSCLAIAAQTYPATHMGSVGNCLPVVIGAAKVQRRQLQFRAQIATDVSSAADIAYSLEAERHRHILKVVVIWAAHRISMGLLAKHDSEIDLAKVGGGSGAHTWMRTRASRFLAKWRSLGLKSHDKRTNAEKKIEGFMKKPNQYFLLALDANGSEFEIRELVSLALMAGAFLRTTDYILHAKTLRMRAFELPPEDLEADLTLAAKALHAYLVTQDYNAVLRYYGDMMNISTMFHTILGICTTRALDRKIEELTVKGITPTSREEVAKLISKEEQDAIRRDADLKTIRELLKYFVGSLTVSPHFGVPFAYPSKSVEGKMETPAVMSSSVMFSASGNDAFKDPSAAPVETEQSLSDTNPSTNPLHAVTGKATISHQLKPSHRNSSYLLNRPKFDAMFPSESSNPAASAPPNKLLTSSSTNSEVNIENENEDDDVSYHGPEKLTKLGKDRLITVDLNPLSHSSDDSIEDKVLTRLKSQNPVMLGEVNEEFVSQRNSAFEWSLNTNRKLRENVKSMYESVLKSEVELNRMEASAEGEVDVSESLPALPKENNSLVMDPVAPLKSSDEEKMLLGVQEIVDMTVDDPADTQSGQVLNQSSMTQIPTTEELTSMNANRVEVALKNTSDVVPQSSSDIALVTSQTTLADSRPMDIVSEVVDQQAVPEKVDQVNRSSLGTVALVAPVLCLPVGTDIAEDKSATGLPEIVVSDDPFDAESVSQQLLCVPCTSPALRVKLHAPTADGFVYPKLYNGLANLVTEDPSMKAVSVVESSLRMCVFCHDGSVGDIVCGRVMTSLDGHFFHINCLRFSNGIIENSNGVLEGALAVLERVIGGKNARRGSPCLLCREKGASVSCAYNQTCSRYFHLKCALACQFSLMEVKSAEVDGPLRKDGKFDIQAIAVCPEHYPRFATSRLTKTPRLQWRPCDPLRLLTTQAASEYLETREYIATQLKEKEGDIAARSGALTVLDIGHPKMNSVFFHTPDTIFPHGFKSMRIYWSMKHAFQRTIFMFEVLSESDIENLGIDASNLPDPSSPSEPCDRYSRGEQSYQKYAQFLPTSLLVESTASRDSAALLLHRRTVRRHREKEGELENYEERPVFKLMFADDPTRFLIAKTIEAAYYTILNEVDKCHEAHCGGIMKRQDRVSYGITPCQFFGLTLPFVQQAIESKPESLMAVTFAPPASQYKPCFRMPVLAEVARVQNYAKALKGFQKVSVNGSARADAHESDIIPGRRQAFTRILAKAVTGEAEKNGNVDEDGNPVRDNLEEPDYMFDESNAWAMERLQSKYREFSEGYLLDPYARLLVRRSHIHGWGLFARVHFAKDDMIIEYIGEKIRQVVADRRESQYEQEGVGSCYLFRLDKEDIVDATRTGGMARFINHCCEPNAYARVITTDGDQKHIIIFAGKSIQIGEEITYDYKFPIEDKKLKCYCGAPKCSGSMN